MDFYYSTLDSENDGILQFLSKAFRLAPIGARHLEFGGGPTIYSLISAANSVGEICFSDYDPQGLQEVARWLAQEPQAFNWVPYIERVLDLEGSSQSVAERASLIRAKTRALTSCDAFESEPMDPGHREAYDVIGLHFVAECLVDNREDWSVLLRNILWLMRPNGLLVMSCILGDSWRVMNRTYPAAQLTSGYISNTLHTLKFEPVLERTIEAEPISRVSRGYEGISMTVSRRS